MSEMAVIETVWQAERESAERAMLRRTRRDLQRIQIELDLNDKHEALIVLLHRVGVLK